jgi:hypothetical protein
MDEHSLHSAATYIVARNLTQNVMGAAVQWDAARAHLCLLYACASTPTEKDEENMELAMAELLAQFADIRTAECQLCEAGAPEWLDCDKTKLVFERNV